MRYDPGLRVRWSHEKGRWAVDAAYRFDGANPRDWLTPPVRYERVADLDMYVEHLLPEYSERSIEFHDRRYVVCFAKHVDWRLYGAVVYRDCHRGEGQMVGAFDRSLIAAEKEKQKAAAQRKDERVYLGWDLFKHHQRKLGLNAEDGAGVSIKGMKW